MAKEGFELAEEMEPYQYTNPVTGQHKIFFRKRHDVTHSLRLAAFERCMHVELEGKHYRGDGPKLDEEHVHEAFREAVAKCKSYDKMYPSDRHD